MWKKSESEEPQTQAAPQPQIVAPPPRNPAPKTQERALIGASIFIKGDLMGEEDLFIEGRVEGRIEFKQNNVTIGRNGRVKADIVGKLISIEGEVEGNLHGEEQLVLRQSSNVRGNITAPRVTLEDGCHFKGSIDMCPKDAADSARAQVTGGQLRAHTLPDPGAIGDSVKAAAISEGDREAARKQPF